MKSFIAIFSLGSILFYSSAFAEQVNPRALDEKNTPSEQGKEVRKGAKTKSMENATEQQSDPQVKSKQHPEQHQSGNGSTSDKGKAHE